MRSRGATSRPSSCSRTASTTRRETRWRRPASSAWSSTPIGVGNSLRNSPSYRDVRVADLACPEQLPVGQPGEDHGPHRAGRAVGPGGEGGARGGRQDRSTRPRSCLRDGGTPQEVSFQFVPTVKGRHSYAVRIPAVLEERIVENNQRTAVAQVVDSKIRVLYIEGTLRAEYGALVQRFLSKDPDLEFCALVQTRPNVFVRRTNMEGLKLAGLPADAAAFEGFDVIVLGDIDSSYWKPGPMELLVKRVRDGAGLLVIGGYHSLGPGGYGGHAARGDPAGPGGGPRRRPDHRAVPAGAHPRGPRPSDLREHRQVLPDTGSPAAGRRACRRSTAA